MLLNLGISIYRRDECMRWIEFHHLLVFFDGIGDIGSLHFSLSLESVRMYYIHYGDSLITICLDDLLGIGFSVWCARLCSK